MKDILLKRAEQVHAELIRCNVAYDFVRGFEREIEAIVNITFAHMRAASRLLLPRGRQKPVCERIVHEWPLRFPKRLAEMKQRIENMIYVDIIHTQEFNVTTSWETHANATQVIDWLVKRFEKHDDIETSPNAIEIDALKKSALAGIFLPDTISWSSAPTRHWEISANEVAMVHQRKKTIHRTQRTEPTQYGRH